MGEALCVALWQLDGQRVANLTPISALILRQGGGREDLGGRATTSSLNRT